jgi:Transposase IS66 family
MQARSGGSGAGESCAAQRSEVVATNSAPSSASTARLPVRHRGRRRDLRAAHEGAVLAGARIGPAAASSGRSHATPIPTTLERDLAAVMALAPTARDGRRLRKRYGKLRAYLFTFLEHPEIAADNNSSERELRPTATYRKVTGGFRSKWGPDLFAAFRSIVGTAARRGISAYQAIKMTLQGKSVLAPG